SESARPSNRRDNRCRPSARGDAARSVTPDKENCSGSGFRRQLWCESWSFRIQRGLALPFYGEGDQEPRVCQRREATRLLSAQPTLLKKVSEVSGDLPRKFAC